MTYLRLNGYVVLGDVLAIGHDVVLSKVTLDSALGRALAKTLHRRFGAVPMMLQAEPASTKTCSNVRDQGLFKSRQTCQRCKNSPII